MAQIKLRLSRRERTARTKIIQEHHYNKRQQRRLDQYVVQYHTTYQWVYTSIKGGAILTFMAEIGVEQLSAVFLKATFSVFAATEAFRKMAAALKEFWS